MEPLYRIFFQNVNPSKAPVSAAVFFAAFFALFAGCRYNSFTESQPLKEEVVVSVSRENDALLIEGLFGSLKYDLDTGLAELSETSGQPVLKDIYAHVVIDGADFRTYESDPDSRTFSEADINDAFGQGKKITVKNLYPAAGNPAIIQNFYVYTGRRYILIEALAEKENGLSINYFAALKAGREGGMENILSLPSSVPGDPRFLAVPFDNDEFVRYNARPLFNADSESYEVTAVYDNVSRRGLVSGSVTHDKWKTGINLFRTDGGVVTGFAVFGGITSFQTRDTQFYPGSGRERERVGDIIEQPADLRPHGFLSGVSVSSPKIFLGFYDDWRDGLEDYGRANGTVAPALGWKHGAPYGWNHWSAYDSEITYDRYISAADFIKDSVPGFKNGAGANWVNFDSFWDRLSEDQRKQAAEHVKKSGLKPGIYHTPFTTWWGSEDELRRHSPEGLNQYTWFDLVLKDKNGRPLRYMGGKGWPLDPTHPGTIAVNDLRMKQFLSWGFQYVKLDFLSHGAMEGVFYEKSITTGIQAYNYGMSRLNESLGKALADGNFFISLSIAPVFPSQWAHSRRISCDVFGQIANTEYLLNSLSYGWWLHKNVYTYNDPDHITVWRRRQDNESGQRSPEEGISAHLAAALCGGLMLNSDRLDVEAARQRVKEILNNDEVNKLAAGGRTFRPVEGNTSHTAADVFIRDDRGLPAREGGGFFYIAAFNFGSGTKSKTVKLSRLGLDPSKTYKAQDMLAHADLGVINAENDEWTLPEMTARKPALFKIWE